MAELVDVEVNKVCTKVLNIGFSENTEGVLDGQRVATFPRAIGCV